MNKYIEFPEVEHIILNEIRLNFNELRKEAQQAYNNNFFVDWVSKQLYDHGWCVLGFRYEDKDFDNEIIQQILPVLFTIYKKYDKYLHSIAYSSFAPSTVIKPHFDRKHPHNILRCHLGLIVPAGDCKLKVNGIERTWEEGKFLMFDDAYVHEAWNKTDDFRVVLLLDFFKDKLI